MKSRITINDVARSALVSTATVSRVLNNSDYPVRPEIRQKVLETAERLNYTPNLYGRNLKIGKSTDIGVIVPSMINPFYAETIAGIEQECRQRGYNPIFCSSSHKVDNEMKYIDLLQQKCVEGMLISSISQNEDELKRILERNHNIVLFDQPAICGGCDSVTFNFQEAGRMAARYLISKGHRDIAFLTQPFDRKSRLARLLGLKEGMAEGGLTFQESRLFVTDEETNSSRSAVDDSLANRSDDEFRNGMALARKFLDSCCPATAVAAINDITALGVIHEFIHSGLRVPQDISVIGFDNIGFSVMSNPSLTTINQPSVEMGKIAARLLIDRITGEIQAYSNIILSPSVVERESVRRI